MSLAASSAPNAILTAWSETLRRRGPAPAVLDERGGVLRTFAGIEHEAAALEAQVAHLPTGAVVGVQIGNDATWPAWLLALFRRRLVPLPLGRHMEAAELAAALQVCGAEALITLEAGDPRLQPVASPSALPLWPEPAPQFLKLTSGTSSAPRAVRFQSSQLVADCDTICATMGISEEDLNYAVIPISHSYGFSNLLTPLLCRGVAMAVSDDRLPRAVLQGLAATGATVFPGMPVFYDKLAALESAPALPRLRLCISAGAPLGPAVASAFTARFGLKVHTFYGSSECGGIGYDASEELRYEEGCVGTPMRGVEISPVEGDRIAIRSGAVADGYWPPEEEGALVAGTFTPGDLITWEGQRMTLAGRASDLINIAGRKLNPAEVEAVMAQCPGVRQVVVFGTPSKLRGEEPVACVAGTGLERAALARWCEERLSGWQRPRDFWLVEEIAANERGKISRRALAGQYEQRAR